MEFLMAEYTSGGLYIPGGKIALASSFEGIVNNGATECGLVAINAHYAMGDPEESFYGTLVSPEEFNEDIVNGMSMRAFLKLRPLAEVAEDYLTILQVIEKYPAFVNDMLRMPDKESVYDAIEDRFRQLRDETPDERSLFKEKFYSERQRLQKKDYHAWLSTQSPFPGAIEQFRMLAETQDTRPGNDNEIVNGFIPWFATSKDEASSYALCELYSELGRFGKEDVSEEVQAGCAINRDRIIGKERTRDKLEQMKWIAASEDIPHHDVWRLNDRYDKEQQEQLADNSFQNQFLITGGYAFPHDVRKAENDSLVTVMPRERLALELARYAEYNGF